MNFVFVLFVLFSFVTFSDCSAPRCVFEKSILKWRSQMVDIYDNSQLTPIPFNENKTEILFNLYTRKNPENSIIFDVDRPEVISKVKKYFNPRKSTFFITHGFSRDASYEMCVKIRDAYLKYYDVNVIVVDWGNITSVPYYNNQGEIVFPEAYKYAVGNMDFAVTKVADMINIIHKTTGINLNYFTLVGHSLGAQLFGRVGHRLDGKIGVIVGLDPAYPRFRSHVEEKDKLSPSDAQYVQVIHTNSGILGQSDPIGTADFYIEDGVHQPGCPCDIYNATSCAHNRAWEIFEESIHPNVQFWGTKCNSVSAALYNGSITPHPCKSGNLARMGGIVVDRSVRGIYNVKTKDSSPFAIL